METGLWRLDPRSVPEAVALLLPGGTERSYARAATVQPSYLRMAAFALSLHRWGSSKGLSVWQVRYRYRGWNGQDMSPLDDGLHALDEVRRRHGTLPVALVGHSMGGRAALRLAGDPSVRGVVGLAPWVPRREPTAQLARRRVVLAHGTCDHVLAPGDTTAYAARAAQATGPGAEPALVRVVMVRGDGHALMLRPLTWDRLVRASVEQVLEGAW